MKFIIRVIVYVIHYLPKALLREFETDVFLVIFLMKYYLLLRLIIYSCIEIYFLINVFQIYKIALVLKFTEGAIVFAVCLIGDSLILLHGTI